MGVLDKAKPLEAVTSGKLWVTYGKSGSGKTAFIGGFPKPLLYIQFGDDGSGTLEGIEGIKIIRPESFTELKDILLELRKDKVYKTVACDTFSLLVEEWIDANAAKKNKRMSQQMWGDLKTDASELIREFKGIAKLGKEVVLTCHEVNDGIEGMEEEILPEVRPSMNKGVRTYLEGMANFGIHMVVKQKDKPQDDGTVKTTYIYGAHIGPNPYYWTKTQKPPSMKIPSFVPNLTYTKLKNRLLSGNE